MTYQYGIIRVMAKANDLNDDTSEDMAQTIVAITRMQGECSRLDLVKAGFSAQQLANHYAMASAMAAVILTSRPKAH